MDVGTREIYFSCVYCIMVFMYRCFWLRHSEKVISAPSYSPQPLSPAQIEDLLARIGNLCKVRENKHQPYHWQGAWDASLESQLWTLTQINKWKFVKRRKYIFQRMEVRYLRVNHCCRESACLFTKRQTRQQHVVRYFFWSILSQSEESWSISDQSEGILILLHHINLQR